MHFHIRDATTQAEPDALTYSVLVRHVRKTFGNATALAHIDLYVRPGEIVAILGPNGAGKTTLLRILSTVALPDEGTVVVGGIDVTKNPRAAQRNMGLSFGEDRAWYWRLSGRHNLEFFATLYGLPKKQAFSRINTLLEEFSLSHVADRPFSQYSSGMKARFSLIRALLPSPDVLLLDEPTRSLDPMAAHEFRETICRQRDKTGMGVLLTTHDMHEAAVIADRILVLVSGRIVKEVAHGPDAAELHDLLIHTVQEWA